MNKSTIGKLAIILGALVLSLQVYGLKLIQGIEANNGSSYANAIDYATKSPTLEALCITVGIIIYGIVLIVKSEKEKNKG